MAKRKNWLDRLKNFFTSETQSKQEKKDRRRRWLFGRLKSKFSPALPPPSLLRLKSLREAEQEQTMHAVAVAIATAAAAEAAVAAAQAAAQVVRLTGNSLSYQRTQEIAATKIQTAFRGYLARRALRALKGLVKLQALIRGQAVRRQTNITLKGLKSLMKIQSQACANRMKTAAHNQSNEDKDVFHLKALKDRLTVHTQAQHSDRMWNGSILSKDEIISLLRKRQEAAFKRERAMDYASTYQERRHFANPTTPISDHELNTNTRHANWSWLDSQPQDKDIHEVSPLQCRDRIARNQQLLASESPSEHKGKAEDFEIVYQARRSFNRSERAQSKDDDFFSSSPYFPSYMASTASTKAKFRSASTPKQRQGTLNSSDHCSLNKDKLLSPLPFVKTPLNHQRSPRLRGNSGPAKHFSIDSERSLVNHYVHGKPLTFA
ncbi:Protein IQ-DOMAIN 14 [Dendrobium catenatum]|uniref:Protein IQ-DOMAIN 14 n=1 Tax=Dendrobium catenatum TaxID=906689 RepID=A0A2I0VNA2_9ASPA|nr:Protein IQ-DOMAIN 14 [Dendrobium catenatum]